MGVSETPLACNLAALEESGGPEARRRHADVSKQLVSSVLRIEERDAGWALVLPADTASLSLVAEFIARERRCCPFLYFDLRVKPHDDVASFEISGPPGAKALLREGLVAEC